MARNVRTRTLSMAVIRRLCGLILRHLAGLEFDLFENGRPQVLRRSYLRWMRVQHGPQMAIGSGIYIRMKENLILGNRCALGSYTRIWNYAPIEIGEDFLGAAGLTLNSGTHDPVTLESAGLPIRIGKRVWCGQNATILAGVTIGDDVVIGAGSVVVHDIPPRSIAAGVPARVIKPLNRTGPFVHPLFSAAVS